LNPRYNLAQYVFSAFGTCSPVLRQEDTGIDMHCTLVEYESPRRAWPDAYFAVQVKGDGEEWVFRSPKSVRFLVRYPAPLLLCVVDKKSLRMRVYQTTGRFHIGALETLPNRLTLVPGDVSEETEQRTVSWPPGQQIGIGPPILQFYASELDYQTGDPTAKQNFERIASILRFWVLNDAENIARMQAGLPLAKAPGQYMTNALARAANAEFWVTATAPEKRATAQAMSCELLNWLGQLMLGEDDRVGALLAGMILRHIDPARPMGWAALSDLSRAAWLQASTALTPANGAYASVDAVLADVRSKC
jgi:hypothetical protein